MDESHEIEGAIPSADPAANERRTGLIELLATGLARVVQSPRNCVETSDPASLDCAADLPLTVDAGERVESDSPADRRSA